MTHDKVIYVCGTPSGGASVTAGILHHLGVNMGNPGSTTRPYLTFEDKDTHNFNRPLASGETINFISGPGTGRRFRDYLNWRLKYADGPCGVKIGSTHWIGDEDPATLPIRILKIDRPLEQSILSDMRYQAELTPATTETVLRRSCQMAGYWMAKEMLCNTFIQPTLTLDFEAILNDPQMAVVEIQEDFGLKPTTEQFKAAVRFVDPDLRNV